MTPSDLKDILSSTMRSCDKQIKHHSTYADADHALAVAELAKAVAELAKVIHSISKG